MAIIEDWRWNPSTDRKGKKTKTSWRYDTRLPVCGREIMVSIVVRELNYSKPKPPYLNVGPRIVCVWTRSSEKILEIQTEKSSQVVNALLNGGYFPSFNGSEIPESEFASIKERDILHGKVRLHLFSEST